MVGPDALLPDGESTFQQRERLGRQPLLEVHCRELSQGHGDEWMVRAAHVLVDCDGASEFRRALE